MSRSLAFPNTSMHWEEESRYALSACNASVHACLELPPIGSSRCADLHLQLTATLVNSADAVHNGLKSLKLCTYVKRCELNPFYIEGETFRVLPMTNKDGNNNN